jgi:hypothetical protein
MTGRPCNPDSDLKGLWRTLLGTPFPVCGIAEDSDERGGGLEAEQGTKAGSEAGAKVPVSDA